MNVQAVVKLLLPVCVGLILSGCLAPGKPLVAERSPVYTSGPYSSGDPPRQSYVVKKGDTLYSIGQRFGVPYQVIAEANNITKLDAGDKIIIPGLQTTPSAPYVVITSPWSGATVSAASLPVYGTGGNLFEGRSLFSGIGLLCGKRT